MDNILTVRNEHLQRLNAEDAVIFFRELLWAEARRIGVPLCKINVSSWVNVPDGGIDASISDCNNMGKDSFISNSFSSFQIKTGSDFAPWQKAQIKKELFGDKLPSKENLGKGIKNCLDKNGAYILVSFGKDLTSQQRQDAKEYRESYLTRSGYKNPQVDVWSLNNIISFLKPFPALALRANRRDQIIFVTHEIWSRDDEMRKKFIPGNRQEKLISDLQTELRREDQPVHIRLWGEAGVGKTRLVLEATDTDDLRPLIIYCNAGKFEDAARLLLALGEAENETWSNNASGIFAELFSISPHSQLSQTEASPQERFPIIKEALESDSTEKRALALRACDNALRLKTSGIINQDLKIIGKEPEPWIPKTYGEIFNAYRLVWTYLFEKLDCMPEEERQEVAKIFLSNAGDIGRIKSMSNMVIDTINTLSNKPYIDKWQVLQTVIQILRYEDKHMDEGTRRRWKELKDKLTGTDFSSLMKRYVVINILEDYFDDERNRVDHVQSWIEKLAQQAIENQDLLYPELSWLVTSEAKNGSRFGYVLGKRDAGFRFLRDIIDAQKNANAKNASIFFLGGYLRAIFERDPKKWEELLNTFSQNEKIRTFVPELTVRSGAISDQAAIRILNLAKRGLIDFRQFQIFFYGNDIQRLNKDLFAEWVKFLISNPNPHAAYIALILYYNYYEKCTHRLPEELTEITKQYPKEIWKLITKYIGPPIDSRAYEITGWLGGKYYFEQEAEGALSLIPQEIVWQWVGEEIEKRAWYLASFIPKGLFRKEGKICWAREVLVRYGDREDVRRNLYANLSSEGWSGQRVCIIKKRNIIY